jgi:hypothetical protein
MTRDDIIKWAQEVGFVAYGEDAGEYRIPTPAFHCRLERFANIVEDAQAKRMFEEGIVTVGYMRQQIAAERNKVASWMMAQGYATGHGDTVEDLLQELGTEIEAKIAAEREACAKVCDGEATIEGIAQRCAAAIRARGQA